MRPIDADALEKYLSDSEIEATRQRKYVFASALNMICGNVRNFPTIKSERKKGEWLHISDGYCDILKCSQCGKTTDSQSNYCPNCGADMRSVK